MDPLGATASIITVLQLTTSVVQYLDDVKGASDSRERMRSAICSADEILCILKSRITAASNGNWDL